MKKLRKALRDPRVVIRHVKQPFYHVVDHLYLAALFVASCIRHGGVRKVIVLPDSFDHIGYGYRYSLWRALLASGTLYYHRLIPRADLAIAWRDETIIEIDPALLAQMQAAAPHQPVLNARCTDVSKSTVGRTFAAVFGYALDVDPTTWTSTLVRKSERNFQKDGLILQGPVAREDGYVYQRLIDNEIAGGRAMDFRVVVVGDAIAYVLQYWRPLAGRFGIVGVTNYYGGKLHPRATDVFSAEEIANVLEFSRRMGCDYTELDVLRDNGDGRIYIVDCNHTPGLIDDPVVRFQVMRAKGEAFYDTYLRR